MNRVVRWPPPTPFHLEEWLRVGKPQFEKRLEILRDRRDVALATIHQPVTARPSQIKVARNSSSDPTFKVVEMWLDLVPRIDDEIRVIESAFSHVARAASALEPLPRALIARRYDEKRTVDDILPELGVSRSTFYRIRDDAMATIHRVILWMSADGHEVTTQGEAGVPPNERAV